MEPIDCANPACGKTFDLGRGWLVRDGNKRALFCSQECSQPLATNVKDTNPKDAVGVRKARWFSYIPLQVLVGVGLAMLEGARKYGRHNYRVSGIRASVYVDAAVNGHLVPWMEGEDIDPDSGLSHIDKAIASLMVLRDGMLNDLWTDDRPPAIKNKNLMAEAHKKACEIIDRYPDCKPAFTRENT